MHVHSVSDKSKRPLPAATRLKGRWQYPGCGPGMNHISQEMCKVSNTQIIQRYQWQLSLMLQQRTASIQGSCGQHMLRPSILAHKSMFGLESPWPIQHAQKCWRCTHRHHRRGSPSPEHVLSDICTLIVLQRVTLRQAVLPPTMYRTHA